MTNASYVVLVIAVMIKNVAAIAAFTYLAIYFNHWWIVLFSAFFMSRIQFQNSGENNEEESNNDEKRLS